MHWILQSNLFNEAEWENLVNCLERFKIPYSVHKVIPFIGELVPPAEPRHEKVICIGSYSMRHTAKTMGWNPGVYDLADITFPIQLKHWGNEMLNADATVVPFKEAWITKPTFIRPTNDTKYFAGKVFDPDDFMSWKHSIIVEEHDYGTGLNKDTELMLCKPKEIYAEYRFWIVNGRIVAQSQYKIGHRVKYSSDVDREVISYANSVGRGIRLTTNDPLPWLPKAFVLDVCKTPDGFKIVEINTINSAGFYAADMQLLVMALEHAEGCY